MGEVQTEHLYYTPPPKTLQRNETYGQKHSSGSSRHYHGISKALHDQRAVEPTVRPCRFPWGAPCTYITYESVPRTTPRSWRWTLGYSWYHWDAISLGHIVDFPL